MNEKTKVSVNTVSVDRRCRAGVCFGKTATVATVTQAQLDTLQADGYLQVQVLPEDKAQTPKTTPTPPPKKTTQKTTPKASATKATKQ